jgi:MFS-type transporter involved in bile tolerance (Atg22 family)
MKLDSFGPSHLAAKATSPALSPHAVGWIIDTTHSTTLGVYPLGGCLLVGSLLVLTMPKRLVNR